MSALDLTPSTRQVNLYLILIQGVFFLRVFLKLYAGQEATARTGHGTTDWFQIGKGAHQGCILSPCLFNFYAEYIMRRWAGRSTSWTQDCWQKYQSPQICRWHHPHDRQWRGTKMPLDESERGEWKSWLKVQHSENEDHGIWSHHFMADRWGNSETVSEFIFGALQNHCRWWLQPWN